MLFGRFWQYWASYIFYHSWLIYCSSSFRTIWFFHVDVYCLSSKHLWKENIHVLLSFHPSYCILFLLVFFEVFQNCCKTAVIFFHTNMFCDWHILKVNFCCTRDWSFQEFNFYFPMVDIYDGMCFYSIPIQDRDCIIYPSDCYCNEKVLFQEWP